MAGKTDYKNKWQAENCERISLVVKKGKKQIIKDFNQLSLYRAFPFILKSNIYIENIDFNKSVRYINGTAYYNRDFDNKLKLTLSNTEKNYFIVQHLNGTHLPCDDPINESIYLINIIHKYIKQLQDYGIYENTSIIITSDHGKHNESSPEIAGTPILLIKKFNETYNHMQISNAPVYHEDIQATILDCAGLYNSDLDINTFGYSADDIPENTLRERTWYDRRKDDNYNKIQNTFMSWNNCNVYYSYTYYGNEDVLKSMVKSKNITKIIQMNDYRG